MKAIFDEVEAGALPRSGVGFHNVKPGSVEQHQPVHVGQAVMVRFEPDPMLRVHRDNDEQLTAVL
jgi:hypothetical protein